MDCPFCGNDRFVTHTEMGIDGNQQTIYYAHNSQFIPLRKFNNCSIEATNSKQLWIICSRRNIHITDYKKEFISHNAKKELRSFEVLVTKGYKMGS